MFTIGPMFEATVVEDKIPDEDLYGAKRLKIDFKKNKCMCQWSIKDITHDFFI